MNLRLLLLLPSVFLVCGGASAQAVRPAPATGPLIVQQPPSHPGNPTYTPQGASASHGGLPGVQKATLPPSPNKRLLPPTKEAGLWAADGAPRAADEPLRILDVPLEVRHPQHPNFQGTSPEVCAKAVHNILFSYINPTAMARLTKEARACLVADLFLHCNERVAEWASRFEAPRYAKTALVAQDFRRQKCSGQILHPELTALMADLRQGFDRQMKEE